MTDECDTQEREQREKEVIHDIRHLFVVRTRRSPPEVPIRDDVIFGQMDVAANGQSKDEDAMNKDSGKEEEEDEVQQELCDRHSPPAVEKITDPDRIEEIINEMHGGIWNGHRGINATEHAIKQYFNIPNLRSRVTEFIAKCDECQRSKHSRCNRNLPMALTTTCSTANEKIGIDIIGPFKYANRGKRYALTIQDEFTKFITFCALADCTANSVAKAIIEEWILVFGIPREILSDNAPNLCGEVMTEIARYFGVRQIRTSIGHPRANGSVEKAHLRLAEFMRATESEMEAYPEWVMKLKLAAYAQNTTVHKTTGFTPHQLMFGTMPRLISAIHNDKPFTTAGSYVEKMQQQLQDTWDVAKERTILSKEKTQARDAITKPKRRIEEYRVGQQIMVLTETLKGKVNRTENPWSGPFTVAEVHDHCIRLKGRKSTVNKSSCKPYLDPTSS